MAFDALAGHSQSPYPGPMSEHRHGPGGHRHDPVRGCSGHTHAHGHPPGAHHPHHPSSDEQPIQGHAHAHHGHDHDGHVHDHTAGASGGILAAAFTLTALFMLVEFVGGVLASS